MKKYIYINYFRDANEERRKEYLHCVNSNLKKDFIDHMIVFLENDEHQSDLPESNKIQYVSLPRRMEFQDVFDHVNANLEPDSIVIILNLDIFLENSDPWRNIGQEFFSVGHHDKAMVLTRHNVESADTNNIVVEADSWHSGCFCDAWVLKTPLHPDFAQQDFKFCVGNAPQCDNLMMGLMSRYYHTYSWGSKYRIYHYDVCRGTKDMQDKVDKHPEKVDHRPKERKQQHRNIPTMQPWDYYLENKIRPYFYFTWFDYLKTAPAAHDPKLWD